MVATYPIATVFLKICCTLLMCKTINAVTVMFAVMKRIQHIINAVPVMPVKMYQTVSKHIMFRCHCVYLSQICRFDVLRFFWPGVGIANIYARGQS